MEDNFTGPGPSSNRWYLPFYGSGNFVVTQNNDRLEILGVVTSNQTEEMLGMLHSKAVGNQTGDWEVTVDLYVGVESDLSGITDNDIVHTTLKIEPSGSGNNSAEVNLGLINPESGFDHGVRFGSQTGGTESENIVLLNDPNGLMRSMRLQFDASTKVLSGWYYDPGTSQYVQLGSVDTSAWGMGGDDYFKFFIAAGAARRDSNQPYGNCSVDTGDASLDNFRAQGEGISLIPEPLGAGLFICASAVLAYAPRIRAAPRFRRW